MSGPEKLPFPIPKWSDLAVKKVTIGATTHSDTCGDRSEITVTLKNIGRRTIGATLNSLIVLEASLSCISSKYSIDADELAAGQETDVRCYAFAPTNNWIVIVLNVGHVQEFQFTQNNVFGFYVASSADAQEITNPIVK